MHYALDHLTGPVLKKLTHDTLFHNVMTNSREALTGFLAAVLHVRPEEITDITFLDTVDYYKRVSSKKIGLDIKLELNHTTIVNIEMQAYHQENWDKRELFYTGRMMAAQKADSQYSNVLPVIHIGVLEKDSSDDFLFLDQYNLVNENGKEFSVRFAIISLNLRNLKNATEEDERRGLVRWAKLFLADTWDEIRDLAEEDFYIRKAGEYMSYALTPEEWLQMRIEDGERDYQAIIYSAEAQGKREGMAKGLEEGRAKGLEEGRAKGREEGREEGHRRLIRYIMSKNPGMTEEEAEAEAQTII